MPTTPTATSDAVIAAGPALARVEQRIATRRQQTALVLATLTVAGAALATGHDEALAIVQACVVARIALTASLAMLSSDRHAHVLELIADGHGGLPCPPSSANAAASAPSHLAQLARSLHELADQASLRVARPHPGRPLYTPIVLTAFVAELHATARRLEEQPVGLRGVARTELLLTAHDSPLYGIDPRRLREDLRGIAFALQSIETGVDRGSHETTPCRR